MKFIDKLRKIFFNEENIGIINIGDLLQIPGREYFNNRKDIIKLIDEYKNDYLKILSQRKKVFTRDISIDNINNKKDMYLKLVLNILMDDFINIRLLDSKVILFKLKLYFEKILNVENETISRLIALKELEKGKRVPLRNRDTLKNEINNLSTSIYVLFTQKMAIKKEIDNYLTNISINNTNILNDEIKNRINEVIEYTKSIMNIEDIIKIEKIDNMSMMEQILVIALLETKLEEYIYNNKFEINKLNDICDNLLNNYNLDEFDIQYKLLKEILKLEKRYMLFYKYGRNIVTDDDFYHLYSAKFKVFTLNILESNDSNTFYSCNLNETNKELEVYDKIMCEKREKIYNKQNDVVNEIFDNNSYNFIKLLSKYIKEDRNRFKSNAIFARPSMEALRLLLALDSMENLKTYLNKNINRKDLPHVSGFNELLIINDIITNSRQFTFASKIPLTTALEVMNIHMNVPTYYRCLYEIYNKLKEKESDKTSYKLPEGIIRIDATRRPLRYYGIKLKMNSNNKDIYMPNSLESIKGNLLDEMCVNNIVLNEGIKNIEMNALKSRNPNILEFTIPSSLETCDSSCIDLSNTKYLIFKNYKESKLLYNPYELGNLINSTLTAMVLNYVYDGKDRVSADVIVIPKKLDSIILEIESNRKVIYIHDIKCYGRINGEKYKDTEYKVNSKLSKKFASKIIERIEKELNKDNKIKKKVK